MASQQQIDGLRSVFASGAVSARPVRRQRLRTVVYRFVASLLFVAASAVAASSEANAPREYLDEETGATVFFVGRPLLFARERATVYGGVVRARPVAQPDTIPGPPGITLAPRDYVTLVAAAVDRSGKYTYLLIGYFWFVGAPEPGENVCFDSEHPVLQLGDRRIELAPFDGSARDAGISQPLHRPIGDAKPVVFAIDLATLGQIAESVHPALYCEAETEPLKYELLEDRLPALRELVRHLSD